MRLLPLIHSAAFVATCLTTQAWAQHMPVGNPPQWRTVHEVQDLKVDYDKAGIYRRGLFTLVAVRELEAATPDAYVFAVYALQCKDQLLSTAALGKLSLDGQKLEHSALLDEAKITKYSVPVSKAQASTPFASRLMREACSR